MAAWLAIAANHVGPRILAAAAVEAVSLLAQGRPLIVTSAGIDPVPATVDTEKLVLVQQQHRVNRAAVSAIERPRRR